MRQCYNNILELIGRTPLVRLNRLNPNPDVEIYVKLESFNPGGSIKDRVAWSMIQDAEARGELTKGKTVIEATSGNTGIGLAMVCAVKGYPLLLAMPESASQERKIILKALGAELLLTPAALGTDGAIEEVYRLVREHPEKYYLPDQFNNPSNPLAHYYGTAQEIWDQTEGQVSMVVITMGTTGTLMGTYRRLKELNRAVQIIGVEPYLGHKLQGLKNMKESYKPGIFDKTQADAIVNIEDEEAFETTRRLARDEGLFLGMSSGAAVAVALRLAQELAQGLIVAICPDGGERYLSTPLFAEKEKPSLVFYNTLTRQKEAFSPLKPGEVTIYTDGPTMNAHLSLTGARRLVMVDLLRRYLEYQGLAVRLVVNLIDLDDKTIQGAAAAGQPITEFTRHYATEFFKDLKALRLKPATAYPRPTEHVDGMLALTRRLMDRGYAYEKLRSVYFDISRFKEYGKLSRIDLTKIRLGKTVDLDEYEKDNPRDFTLLKRAKLGELKSGLYYATEWGNVRPGWHLECAAMALKQLGETIDIYAGGLDQIFPHHENVTAICGAATGKPLARYWLHSERILCEGRKIPEGQGHSTVRELLEQGFRGEDLRYFLMATQYRKSLQVTPASLNAARRGRQRLDFFLDRLAQVRRGGHFPELDQLLFQLKKDFMAAMDDDLNISQALAAFFNFLKVGHGLMDQNRLDQAGAQAILVRFQELDEILGIMNIPEPVEDATIEAQIQAREEARRQRDWPRADQIRQELAAQGIEVIDTQQGPVWRRR
ncbi:MAG: cysteine--tRNA ligase [Deltaproteobacteria bacterium]|nr:cysteine--tRNA ligase [Deltaproteobacteria bacterium]MBW1951477.1 cysteine--tRNA ligase [Deltaproteobacteria bacterium]MBW1986906.1 cysteine--tRNA ligase [Deltaproteobacteria bacterium]MBW2135016.1 cysteine--tRNA ligase [Deltaproteobacteria bacterium]